MKIETLSPIQFNKLLHIKDVKANMESKGFSFINKKNTFRIGLGLVCLGIAVIPNGLGAFFYPLSFMLLGISFYDLKKVHIPEYTRKIKNKLYRRY